MRTDADQKLRGRTGGPDSERLTTGCGFRTAASANPEEPAEPYASDGAGTSNRPAEADDPDSCYPLLDRLIDLFLEPRRLFRELGRRPRLLGALLLSTLATLAEYPAMLPLSGLDLPSWMAGATMIVAALALWGYLCLVALSGLAFGGFAGVDLPFSHWLALAAHCSLVSVLIVPLRVGTALWMGDPDVQLGLGDLLGPQVGGFARAFLSHVSLQTVAFLSLFSLGASVLTGTRQRRAFVFMFGSWTCVWFMLAWFTAGS